MKVHYMKVAGNGTDIQKLFNFYFNTRGTSNEIDQVQNSAHFSNVIYFMPQAFELQNPLSYHAGRNEDMFCETKKLPNSIYNRQQFNPIMYSKQLPIPKIEC